MQRHTRRPWRIWVSLATRLGGCRDGQVGTKSRRQTEYLTRTVGYVRVHHPPTGLSRLVGVEEEKRLTAAKGEKGRLTTRSAHEPVSQVFTLISRVAAAAIPSCTAAFAVIVGTVGVLRAHPSRPLGQACRELSKYQKVASSSAAEPLDASSGSRQSGRPVAASRWVLGWISS